MTRTVLALAMSLAVPAAAVPPATITTLAYGAGLGAQPPAPADGDRLQRIEEKLDRLLKLLEDIAREEPPAAQAQQAPAVLQGAVEVCAKCHTAEKPAGGFRMFELRDKQWHLRADLTDREKRRAVSELEANTMPPPGKAALTADQRAALVELLKGKR